jgi:hypothetical protein
LSMTSSDPATLHTDSSMPRFSAASCNCCTSQWSSSGRYKRAGMANIVTPLRLQ